MRKPLAAVLTAVLVGCGGGATASQVGQTGSATAAPTATTVPAPTDGPTASPVPSGSAAFVSTVYRYAWDLPAGTRTRAWKSATVAWDGAVRLTNISNVVDTTGTVDGALLVWGEPWTGDLSGFSDLVKANAATFGGCSAVDDPSAFEVGGIAGIAQRDACTHEYADVSGVNTTSLRAVMVKGGYGLAFRIIVNPGKELVALEDLTTWLGGLTWTAGT